MVVLDLVALVYIVVKVMAALVVAVGMVAKVHFQIHRVMMIKVEVAALAMYIHNKPQTKFLLAIYCLENII